MDHETLHAKHFKYGIPNIPIERFNFDNKLEKLIFNCVSEVIAHCSHIQALGLSNPKSDYPKKYQQFLIRELMGYKSLAATVFNSGKVNPDILRDVQASFPQFAFRAL